jgi:type II secretory ATPase GspE/PulE/Tfp pilus assembly ATPase PilB-like protein
MHGESVVLRLLDRAGAPNSLADLGLPPSVRTELETLVSRPTGLLLVTGPTGSGKTSTLYGALKLRARDREKIITVEDPIEYQLDGITQVPVQREHGVSFAASLRAILRQDPDVVMVGEMRDEETAALAVQAAMTGHLVLSTLHTTDAIGAIPRLLDLGIPPYLVAASVEGILAQRLVRRICDHCRITEIGDRQLITKLAGEGVARARLSRGEGCNHCRGTGYRGRTGVFEFVRVTEDLRTAISARAPAAQLRELAGGNGFSSLQHDAWEKVRAGITTLDEVARVLTY